LKFWTRRHPGIYPGTEKYSTTLAHDFVQRHNPALRDAINPIGQGFNQELKKLPGAVQPRIDAAVNGIAIKINGALSGIAGKINGISFQGGGGSGSSAIPKAEWAPGGRSREMQVPVAIVHLDRKLLARSVEGHMAAKMSFPRQSPYHEGWKGWASPRTYNP